VPQKIILHNVWKKSYLHETVRKKNYDLDCVYLLEEIALRVRAMHAPPVVREYIEDTKQDDKECCRPFSFEANGNHDACCKSEERHEDATNAPFSLYDETEEKEDKENTSC